MGARGTDVAREAASLVLLDDNFASIVAAMRSGRKIFDNLQKAMTYILAIHIPIIGLTLLPALLSNIPLLLMPLHIVFLELIIDPISSIAFESEIEEKGIMKRLPRKVNDKFFGSNKLITSLFKGLLLLSMVIVVYFITVKEGHNEKEMRAIVYTALIIGNVFLILSSLSSTRSFMAVILEKNYAALFLISTALIMLTLILAIPVLLQIFNFSNPGWKHFQIVLIAVFIMLLILEGLKLIAKKKSSN
jgi:Ca2+-transporting ATPase